MIEQHYITHLHVQYLHAHVPTYPSSWSPNEDLDNFKRLREYCSSIMALQCGNHLLFACVKDVRRNYCQ